MTDRNQTTPLGAVTTASDKRDIIRAEVTGKDVLDVGCLGTDTITGLHEQIRRWSDSVTGIDINEDLAAEIDGVQVADAESYTLESPVDVVVAGDVIEHLSNPGRFIKRSAMNLTANGTLVIATPNALGYRHFLNRFFMRDTVNRNHTCWFDAVTLTQLVGRYDFELDRVVYLQRDGGLGKYVEKIAPQWSRDFVGVFTKQR